MDHLLQKYPWYPPRKESVISIPSVIEYWELEPCSTIYDKMYRIFPERKTIDIDNKVKEPCWRYLDDTGTVKLIKQEDFAEVNKFLMEEYVFYNPLWKEYGVRNETETYAEYKDLLESVVAEGSSLVARSGQRTDGILLCSVLDAGVGEVRLFDPKLGQVMAAEGCVRTLADLLQLTYVRRWALVRLLQTGAHYAMNENRTQDALLRAIWDWALTKGVDCVVAVNAHDKQKPLFAKHGYFPINAISPLEFHQIEDAEYTYDDVKFQTINKTCFFVKFRSKEGIEMFNYTKGFW